MKKKKPLSKVLNHQDIKTSSHVRAAEQVTSQMLYHLQAAQSFAARAVGSPSQDVGELTLSIVKKEEEK
eukprot:CAMPEP_0194760838 /NCGR_PEP_ID=MMETSP0323_2-20130528/13679_1 /TAXON_ID=2866 ORGANISM="Crypthecodinium cohnii, Strain Seligo" /NCGR_SAMPLE_ID=MMETSP0323_2 /ASSEMBLY_ACC=CAM_ASM_000346 /LENGTH=68 /DNA_ID=CAMNT_0039682319 /DNA_START=60 /DNA_END=266 /DNA_ORIENTATION=+